MAIATELGKRLYRKCQLDGKKQELELQKQALEDQLPEAKGARREADFALQSYNYGGFRAFLDRLAGTQEQKRETLARNAAAANAVLDNLNRELERTEYAIKEVEEELRDLAVTADPVEQARELDPEEREVILCKVAGISAARLLSRLETAEMALEEAQEWARPNNRIDTAPGYTKGRLLAKAESCARDCHASLKEIARCGILLEIHPYFVNPSGYIHGVASQYGELDRINKALGAIRSTYTQTKELLLQLTDEEPQ